MAPQTAPIGGSVNDDQQQPGWVAPGSTPAQPLPPPAYPGYPQQPYYPPPFRQAHKPGVVALRPLGLGDLYDGAFTAIRRNPKPMVGLAALVATSALLLPIVVTILLAATGDLTFDLESGENPAMYVTYAGSILTSLAGIVLAGMIVHVVMEATLGRKATIEATWRAVRGRMLRLIGLALVSALAVVLLLAVPVALGVLIGMNVDVALGVVAGGIAFLCAACLGVFLWVRLLTLAAPAMVVERHGVFGSMRRSFELTRGQFWRIFGISLLTTVIVGFVQQILSIPLALVAVGAIFLIDDGTTAALVYVFANYLSIILAQALATPFSAGVQALQYVDQRIRKEAYDVELIAQAQPAPSAY